MRPTARLLVMLVLCVGARPAWAQGGANITVQLPNVTVFGVNTTVLVPDSGPSPLAAQRQARYGRLMSSQFPRRQAIGGQANVGMAGVTAQIHDQRADDEAILRAARARRTNWALSHRSTSGARYAALAVNSDKRSVAAQRGGGAQGTKPPK